jgi:hypothetical protein
MDRPDFLTMDQVEKGGVNGITAEQDVLYIAQVMLNGIFGNWDFGRILRFRKVSGLEQHDDDIDASVRVPGAPEIVSQGIVVIPRLVSC